MAQPVGPDSVRIIGSVGGVYSSRRQRLCATAQEGEALIRQWAGEGCTVFQVETEEFGMSEPFMLADGKGVEIRPLSVDPFVPPPGWTMHTIRAFETRLSVCKQQARRMPKDAVYLLPAIEKLPRWAHIAPATTEYSLMSIERITGCIDREYFEKHAPKLVIEPWAVPCGKNLARYPWFEV